MLVFQLDQLGKAGAVDIDDFVIGIAVFQHLQKWLNPFRGELSGIILPDEIEFVVEHHQTPDARAVILDQDEEIIKVNIVPRSAHHTTFQLSLRPAK